MGSLTLWSALLACVPLLCAVVVDAVIVDQQRKESKSGQWAQWPPPAFVSATLALHPQPINVLNFRSPATSTVRIPLRLPTAWKLEEGRRAPGVHCSGGEIPPRAVAALFSEVPLLARAPLALVGTRGFFPTPTTYYVVPPPRFVKGWSRVRTCEDQQSAYKEASVLCPLLRLDGETPHLLWWVDVQATDDIVVSRLVSLIARNSDILQLVIVVVPSTTEAAHGVFAKLVVYFSAFTFKIWGNHSLGTLSTTALRHFARSCANSGILGISSRIPCPPSALSLSTAGRLSLEVAHSNHGPASGELGLLTFIVQRIPNLCPVAVEFSISPSIQASRIVLLAQHWRWTISLFSLTNSTIDVVPVAQLRSGGEACAQLSSQHVSHDLGLLYVNLGTISSMVVQGLLACGYRPSVIQFVFLSNFGSDEACEVERVYSNGALSLTSWQSLLVPLGYGVVTTIGGIGIAVAGEHIAHLKSALDDSLWVATHTSFYGQEPACRDEPLSRAASQTRAHLFGPPFKLPPADSSIRLPSVYIISLAERGDRREVLLAALAADVGYPMDKVRVIDAIGLKSDGHIGCALSHIKALQRGLDDGMEHIFVLEDDALIVRPSCFADRLRSFFGSATSRSYDVALLSTCCAQLTPSLASPYPRVRGSCGGTAYVVARQYVPTLMATFLSSVDLRVRAGVGALDRAWVSLQLTDVWIAIIHTDDSSSLVVQADGVSDIEGMAVKYTCRNVDGVFTGWCLMNHWALLPVVGASGPVVEMISNWTRPPG